MSRLFLALAALSVFASLSFAASYSGDGSYRLNVSDYIDSTNNFRVTLSGVAWHYGPDQQIVMDSANYTITYGGSTIATPTLAQGASHTASADGGNRNVTVTATELSYIIYSGTAYIVIPNALTAVASQTYEPPPVMIDVEFTNINSDAQKFEATVSWETNVTANGTIYLMNSSGGTPWHIANFPALETTHTKKFQSLKSNTRYYYNIHVCSANSCIDVPYTASFKTEAVIPQITDVNASPVTDTTAVIRWKTDGLSDSIVYYRKQGETTWQRIPPPHTFNPEDLIRYYVPLVIGPAPEEEANQLDKISTPAEKAAGVSQIGAGIKTTITKTGAAIGTTPARRTILFASGGSGFSETMDYAEPPAAISSYYGVDISGSGIVSGTNISGGYRVNSPLFDTAVLDPAIVDLVIKYDHAVNLEGLSDDTTYQYKVQSCADLCINSTMRTFKTKLTLVKPEVHIYYTSVPLPHGTSFVVKLTANSNNPSGRITSAILSWSGSGDAGSFSPKFGGDARSFVPSTQPDTAVASITFNNPGTKTVTFTASDDYSTYNSQSITITVQPKTKCTGTSAKYYPQDTPCNNKWPSGGGAGLNYNNGISACHAFEICDENLDYVVSDAEVCCNGKTAGYSSEPEQNWGYGYNKGTTCDFALQKARDSGAMSSLSFKDSMKVCKAAYMVYGFGAQAIYMKDYYTAEACCKGASFCEGFPHYQAYSPWPASNIKYPELWCYYTDWGWFGKSAIDGWYGSDTNAESNNNALADIPTHASLNTLNTGTCVDYSFAITTMLRKAGWGPSEIMSMRTPGHLYNVVKMPGDTKYSFIDTVGNSGGEFFTGPGWDWKSGGKKMDHCKYDSDRCSNDQGGKTCPAKSQVTGC